MVSHLSEVVEFHAGPIKLVGEFRRSQNPSGTVILLHGGGQTRHSWLNTAERLAAGRWNALSMDTRGHGDSGWAPDGDYSTDAFVEDLGRVVDWLGERPVLVGASMGGATSLIAQGERGLGRALVLVDVVPSLEPQGVGRVITFMTQHREGFGSLEEAAQAVAAYNPHRKRPPTTDGLKKNLRERDDGRWYWHWDPTMMDTHNWQGPEPQAARMRAAATKVSVPVLLIRGQYSDVVSDDGARDLLDLIPHAEFTDVRDAGHMVAGDDNDVFTESLLGFIDKVRTH